MRPLRSLLLLGVLGGCASMSGCFAITDLDRFETRATTSGNFTDVTFTVRGMTSHVAEFFEYRIIDANNTVQSRGIVMPLGDDHATITIPAAVPRQNGPYHL